MFTQELATALASGATVVTPNKRLARALATWYDAQQRERGAIVWDLPRVLPWSAWVDSLWQDALAADAIAPRALLSPAATALLWTRVVADDESILLDQTGAAQSAAEAWSLFHAWRRPEDAFERWLQSGIGDDAATFARWAIRFQALLEAGKAIDRAELPALLAQVAAKVPAWRAASICLAGFNEQTPAQAILCRALADAGAQLVSIATVAAAGHCARVEVATSRDELIAALTWARERALRQPHETFGIVVDDLAQRHDEVVRIADDILGLDLPGVSADAALRPYALSLGLPLAGMPMVRAALDLLAWRVAPLPLDAAVAVLRSPYLPAAAERWTQRAGLEREWRATGLSDIGWQDAERALAPFADPLLVPAVDAGRSTRLPLADWAERWRDDLARLGWPGERVPDSGEWQLREAWSGLLGSLAACGVVSAPINAAEALAALRQLAAATVYQPETPAVRIVVLGALEAAGLAFAGLWLTGMAASRWPHAARPHPLLPASWQRDRGVTLALPAAALAFANALTAGFAQAAPEVIASHAHDDDGTPQAPSALTLHWPLLDAVPAASHRGSAAHMAQSRPPLQSLADAQAPALPRTGAALRGGADLVERQSACPFQAYARHRLRARDDAVDGFSLTAAERGSLLHRALAEWWKAQAGSTDWRSLPEDLLIDAVAVAAATALSEIPRSRWRALPPAVRAGESLRLQRTIATWLVHVECLRPSFTVRAVELRIEWRLPAATLALQVDRIDELEGGGLAIIDYKSGQQAAVGRWFAPRPSGTQLGLYALAVAQTEPTVPVRAVAYGQLKAGRMQARGLAADAAAWPALDTIDKVKGAALPDWTAVMDWWGYALPALVDEFLAGAAAVAPRDKQVCTFCDYRALCRIDRNPLDDDDRDDDG